MRVGVGERARRFAVTNGERIAVIQLG